MNPQSTDKCMRGLDPVIIKDVILIPLTKGKTALINLESYDLVKDYLWHSHGNYAETQIDRKQLKMANLINSPPDGYIVDHENGNSLDNRLSNLRIATQQNNLWNRRLYKNKKTSIYKGVHFSNNRYKAAINHKWIGAYKSEIEAAKAYDEMAKKIHGEFARTNQALGLL